MNNVIVQRVASGDVNNPATAYRYQGAFMYEKYIDMQRTYRERKAAYEEEERQFELIGFGWVAANFAQEKKMHGHRVAGGDAGGHRRAGEGLPRSGCGARDGHA